MKKLELHSLIWLPCSEENGLAKRFNVAGFRGSLPFFISGRDVDIFETTKKLKLANGDLIKGILYGLAEIDGADSPAANNAIHRETYIQLLLDFSKWRHIPSLEEMIASTSSSFRERTGSATSMRALETGIKLITESSMLKMSLVFDLWEVFADNGEDLSLPRRILEIVPSIDNDPRFPDNIQAVRYYGFCSMAYTGNQDELAKYKIEFIDNVVTDSDVLADIGALLADPRSKSPKELLLGHGEVQ